MAGYRKPRVPREEREARRRAWQEHNAHRFGSQGAASECRRIDPATGEVVEVIPRRADGGTIAPELARARNALATDM